MRDVESEAVGFAFVLFISKRFSRELPQNRIGVFCCNLDRSHQDEGLSRVSVIWLPCDT